VEPHEQGLHPATGRLDLLLPLNLSDGAQLGDDFRQAERGRNRRGKVGGPWPGLRLVADLARPVTTDPADRHSEQSAAGEVEGASGDASGGGGPDPERGGGQPDSGSVDPLPGDPGRMRWVCTSEVTGSTVPRQRGRGREGR
jgi:hypothetical protein